MSEGITAMMVSVSNTTEGMVSEVMNEMQEISEDVFIRFPFVNVMKHGNSIYHVDSHVARQTATNCKQE